MKFGVSNDEMTAWLSHNIGIENGGEMLRPYHFVNSRTDEFTKATPSLLMLLPWLNNETQRWNKIPPCAFVSAK